MLEIRPTIKWDKGKALEFLLESLGYANCTDVFPVYIGDDRTDEDAFKVSNASSIKYTEPLLVFVFVFVLRLMTLNCYQILRERGQGFGILVSKTPKETTATYSLQEPAEVRVQYYC